MEQNNSDRHIEDKFAAHEISVNTTELWNNIAPHIKTRTSNKRRIIFFLLFGLLGVSTIIYGLSALSHSFTYNQENAIIEDHSQKSHASSTTEKPIEFSKVESKETAEIKATNKDFVGLIEPNKDKVQSEATEEQILKPVQGKAGQELAIDQQAAGILDEDKLSSQIVLTEEKIQETLNQATIPYIVSNTTIETEADEPFSSKASMSVNRLSILPVTNLILDQHLQIPALSLRNEKDAPAKFSFYLGANVGIANPKMILRASEETHQEFVEYRRSIEKPLESYSALVHTEFRLPKWWSFSVGAEYSEQHYASDHTIIYLEDFNYQDVTIEIIQSQSGQQSEVKGNILGQKEIKVSGIRYHNYRNLSARADVGVWKTWNKHTVHGKIGYSFPLFNHHTGLLYDTPSSDYDLSMDFEERIIKASKQHVSINYEYQLLNQHKLTIGSYFSYEENIFNIDSRVNQMQRSLGIQVGYLIKI